MCSTFSVFIGCLLFCYPSLLLFCSNARCFLLPAWPAWVKCRRVSPQVCLHTLLLLLLHLPRFDWGTTKPHHFQLQAAPAALHCPLATAPLNSSGASKDELSIWLTNRTVTPPPTLMPTDHSTDCIYNTLYRLPLVPVWIPPTFSTHWSQLINKGMSETIHPFSVCSNCPSGNPTTCSGS